IGLIIAVGWLFFDRQSNNEATSTDNGSTAKTENEETATTQTDETANWFKYVSPLGTYSIKIPDGWSLDGLSSGGTDGLWAWDSESIQYAAGKKATVTEIEGGRDGSSIAFALVYDYTNGNNFGNEGSVQKAYKTSSGYEVAKYYFVEPGRDTDMYPPKDTVSYVYDIKYQTKRVAIKHDVLPGETDRSSLIEQMINTLTIN
nr:hypothetical protein [Candidatus Nanoperiomorbaceae bacterium]